MPNIAADWRSMHAEHTDKNWIDMIVGIVRPVSYTKMDRIIVTIACILALGAFATSLLILILIIIGG